VATRNAANGTAIDLAAAGGTLTFVPVAPRGTRDPLNVTLSAADGSATWRWRIPVSAKPRAITVRVQPATYTLLLDAPRARPLRRAPIAVAERVVDLGELRMEPALLVRGRVADSATRRPVAAATVASEDGGAKSTTGVDGNFELLITTPPPWRIVTTHPAYATHVVDLARADGDTVVLPIDLHRGSMLNVELIGVDRAKVTLSRPRGRRRERIDEKEAAPRATFARVDPGDYIVEVRGTGPLEQKLVNVHVDDLPEVVSTLTISPTEISGRVRHGTAPLPSAHVVASQQSDMKGELTTDAAGEFRVSAWDHGTFLIEIEHPTLPAPFRTLRELEDVGTAEWQLDVPDLRVVGHVVDAANGEGIADANVQIESVGDGMSFSRTITTDRRGDFELVGMAGEHAFTVWANGYVASRGIRMTLGNADKVRDVVIRMERQEATDLVIVDAAGNPIADAIVLADLVNGGTEYDTLERTNALGEVKLPIRRGSRKQIWIVPPSGSFAVADVAFDDHPRRIVVPAPVAAMNVLARTTTGEAAANVALLLKFNGTIVPPAVTACLQRTAGSFRTDVAGQVTLRLLPSGMYGIWPYQTPEERDAIVRGLANAAAPVEVALTPGRADVRLIFKPRTTP
jgi:hypothetical protein